MYYRWLLLPAFVAAATGAYLLHLESTPSRGEAGFLNSQPAGAAVKVWQSEPPARPDLNQWAPLGYTPLQVSYQRPVGLFLAGHRPVVLAEPPTGPVRLSPTPAYRLALALPWLASLACLTALGLLWRQARLVEAGEEAEQVRTVGLNPGMWVGPYQVERRIGSGGQADVFLARDQSGREVALKVMGEGLSRDQESRTRFEREVDAGTRFDHPNVIPTLRWSVLEGRYWMAQPYLAGGSLAQRVVPDLPERQIIDWLIDICAGLDYAHRQGTIHRDLKPHNVLLDERGRAVLADFGLARGRRYETITATGVVLGTPAYISPEQVQGQPASPLSDLYSVGVIGYELLTGDPPFQGEVVQVLVAHLNQTPPPLSARRPDVQPGLIAVVERLMEKEPGRRFASALEVLRQLESLCR